MRTEPNKIANALRNANFGYVCEYCEYEDMCRNKECVIIQAADSIEELQAEIDKIRKEKVDANAN